MADERPRRIKKQLEKGNKIWEERYGKKEGEPPAELPATVESAPEEPAPAIPTEPVPAPPEPPPAEHPPEPAQPPHVAQGIVPSYKRTNQ